MRTYWDCRPSCSEQTVCTSDNPAPFPPFAKTGILPSQVFGHCRFLSTTKHNVLPVLYGAMVYFWFKLILFSNGALEILVTVQLYCLVHLSIENLHHELLVTDKPYNKTSASHIIFYVKIQRHLHHPVSLLNNLYHHIPNIEPRP